jgi:holliday junction resolvase YEN1
MTAFKLSRTGLGDSPLHAAQELLAQELHAFLISWHNELQDELLTDKLGFLGWHFPALADCVHYDFPPLCVISQYVRPATSWSNGGDGPDTSTWMLQKTHLADMAALCKHAFSWNSVAINKTFHRNVWDECCV